MALFSHLRSDPVYNTRAVVQRTGVPADTFRAWERRHGLPAPARSPGNQRLYSERDIATISWLKNQTQQGVAISQAVHLFHHPGTVDLSDELQTARQGLHLNGASDGERMTRFRDAIVDALVRFDAGVAAQVVEEAMALVSVEDVCLHVLQPALYEIGRLWQQGAIGISVEHFASAFVSRRLGALFNLSHPEQGRGPVVAACLEGELHDVGLLLTCLFLSRRGFRIVYLGPNLPFKDLCETTQRLRPPIVLLSASTPPSAANLASAARSLRARSEGCEVAGSPPLLVGYGGHIFTEQPELRAGIPAIHLGHDAEEAARTINDLVDAQVRPTTAGPAVPTVPGAPSEMSPMLDSARENSEP